MDGAAAGGDGGGQFVLRLGDEDEDLWERDSQGKPRDPWQFTNYLIMKDEGAPGEEGHLYTLALNSRGGLNAIGDLCKKYGKEMRSKPDEWPVVTLGVDSYNHPNKEYGRIKVPVLTIQGWEAKEVWTSKQSTPKKAAAKTKK